MAANSTLVATERIVPQRVLYHDINVELKNELFIRCVCEGKQCSGLCSSSRSKIFLAFSDFSSGTHIFAI